MTKTQQLEVVASIPPGIDLPTPEVQGEFRKLATDCINAANKALGIYRELCAYIRKQQIHPHFVRVVLKDRGYDDSTVSRIIKVADAPEEIYKEFQKGTLGFRAALQPLARANKSKNGDPTPAKKSKVEEFKAALVSTCEEFFPLTGQRPSWFPSKVWYVAHGYHCCLEIGGFMPLPGTPGTPGAKKKGKKK